LSTAGVTAIKNNLAVVPTKDVSDELIAQAIVAALERNSSVDVDKIEVEVEGRVVKLSGVVPTWIAYLAAQDTVKYTGGVADIINNITIGPQDYPK
jgi:osmotically-inducible protein OsmY